MLSEVEAIAISGSLPDGLQETFYSELITIANKQEKTVVLDCSGRSLEAVLKTHISQV